MSIQRTGFPLVLDPNDFKRTDRGMTWGIKLHEIASFGQMVYLVTTGLDGGQHVEPLDDQFDIRVTRDYGGDVRRWLTEFLLPKLNAWLGKTFPPQATDEFVPPAIDATKFQQAHQLIGSILITVAPDGTLKATAP